MIDNSSCPNKRFFLPTVCLRQDRRNQSGSELLTQPGGDSGRSPLITGNSVDIRYDRAVIPLSDSSLTPRMPTDSPPLDDAAIPSAAAAKEPATAPPMLIVDDEEGIRNFLSRSPERRGWHVTTTGSAEEAALHLERHCVDLIILDIALPGQSGLDWLKELQAAGFGGDVIMKPFRVEQIVSASVWSCSSPSAGSSSDTGLQPFRSLHRVKPGDRDYPFLQSTKPNAPARWSRGVRMSGLIGESRGPTNPVSSDPTTSATPAASASAM